MRGVRSGVVPGRAFTRATVSTYSRGYAPLRGGAPGGRGGWGAYGGKAILAGSVAAYGGWGAYRGGWGGLYGGDGWPGRWADYGGWSAWPAAWGWGGSPVYAGWDFWPGVWGWPWGGSPGGLLAYGGWVGWPSLWDWDLWPGPWAGLVLASSYGLAPAYSPYVYPVPAYEYPFYDNGYSFNAEPGYVLTADADPRIPLW